jgi:hypothetical protein
MPELPNIVRERLKASRPTSAHPDPDVLTAFAERALPESERAVVMEHLAGCHDCRDVLALALPATVTVETARVPLPVRGGWFRAPVLRWGVVAAGFAVVAVAGIVHYQQRHVPQTFIAARQATAPTQETTTAKVSRDQESAKPTAGTPSVPTGSANAVPANARIVNASPVNAIDADAVSKKERTPAPAPPNQAVAQTAARELARPQLTAALPSAATVEVQSESSLVANRPDQAAKQPLQYEAKNQGQGGIQSGGQRSFMDATVDKAKAPASTQQLVAFAPRWTISAAGGLLRSFDQGITWASVDVFASQSASAGLVAAEAAPQQGKYQSTQAMSQVQNNTQLQVQAKTLSKSSAVSRQKVAAPAVSLPVFRAVSAVGPEVWAGGSAGMLYHSADGGEQWTRVVPTSAGILLTGEITGIAFTDSQNGQIATSTQELWTTVDGGQTWQKRQS